MLGDFDGATVAIERALALTPAHPAFLLYTRADILRRRGDEAGVTRTLEAIVRDDPRAVEASVELAAMAFRRGDRAGSEAILTAAYTAGARDPDLLDRLGQTMALEGRDPEGIRYFGEALELWPDDPVALLGAARADLRSNDATRAIERLRRCAEDPHAFECRMELARAYVVGPHDLAAAKRELLSMRARATPAQAAEIDQRLATIDALK